jgi:enoyl-CoA hydratase
MPTPAAFTTLTLQVSGRIATITLNRPERLNAINRAMPGEIRAAVEAANADARVHGYAVAGGSDIATCCGLIVMEDRARIGYMPARVWACPTPAVWVYRLGAMRAKRLLLTGDLIDGRTAHAWGLAVAVAPLARLDAAVARLARRMASVPKNQLMMQKLVINQAVERLGVEQTQALATLLDGIARHSPEGLWFKRYAERHGFPAAVEWRDSGRPLPEPGPGGAGDHFMVPPRRRARSRWSPRRTGR